MTSRVRARLWRSRFLVAAVCLACAAWWVVGQVRPPPAPTVPVAVAAHDLDAGVTLAASDVRVEDLVDQGFPTAAVTEAVGSRLAVALPAGTPILPSALVGPGLVAAAPTGTVVIPVRLADAASASLMAPGDRVDLYLAPADLGAGAIGSSATDATLVAEGVLVLAVDGAGDAGAADAGGSWLGASSGGDGPGAVVAVPRAQAATVAGAGGLAPLRAVIAPP